MVRKEVIDKNIEEVRSNLKEGKIIIGLEKTMKQVIEGNVLKVYLASNTPKSVEEDLESYQDIEVVKLNYPNDELGIMCKKPFSISVLSLLSS